MKVIIAIDSFKGCLTSKEANEAAAEGIRKAYPDTLSNQQFDFESDRKSTGHLYKLVER